jgi:hypothetical protein
MKKVIVSSLVLLALSAFVLLSCKKPQIPSKQETADCQVSTQSELLARELMNI